MPKQLRKKKVKKKPVKDIPFDPSNINILEVIVKKCLDLSNYLGVSGEIIYTTCIWIGLCFYFDPLWKIVRSFEEKKISELKYHKQINGLSNNLRLAYITTLNIIKNTEEFIRVTKGKTHNSLKE